MQDSNKVNKSSAQQGEYKLKENEFWFFQPSNKYIMGTVVETLYLFCYFFL